MATSLTNSEPPFSPQECRQYARLRCPSLRNSGRAQISGVCPFHDDQTPSFSWNLDSGLWFCHSENIGGGLVAFEQKLFGVDAREAYNRIVALLEIPVNTGNAVTVATYRYLDSFGRELCRKLRQQPKSFSWQYTDASGKLVWGRNGIQPPLYNLPAVLRSPIIILCEGEKDCDRLSSLNLSRFDPAGRSVAITTSPDGAAKEGQASKWRPVYNPYFTGKDVIAITDNDASGRAHALSAGRRIAPFAAKVRFLQLPGLPEHGDVSDYLDVGHTVDELMAEIGKAPIWTEAEEKSSLFKTCIEIASESTIQGVWTIPFYVEQSSMTELTGKIKSGKTTFVLDACRAVLDGSEFLGQQCIKGPCVMVTEQSGFSLNEALGRAHLLDRADMTVCRPSDAFGLTWPALIDAAIAECERRHAVFLLVDTLNGLARLKDDDENSAGAMLQIMRQLERAKGRGWGILVTAHERKAGGEVYDSARGSSAAGGVFDTLMSLRRPEGKHPRTVRKISSIGRFSETPSELIFDWNEVDCRYSVLGDLDSIALARTRAKVMLALPTDEAEAKTIEELKEETEESESTLRRVLKEFANLGPGRKGSPSRYYQRTAGGKQ